MQAGFCLFEAGLVRTKNSINVAFKNLSDFTITALVYWAFGFGLMYGDSVSGLFGFSDFAIAPAGDQGAWFLFQLMYCGAAVTIVGGALAERTSYSAYLLLSLLIGTLLYPIPGHWVWAADSLGWLARLGFIDFAGGTAVHVLGGTLALAAVLVVGPRIGRFPSSNSDGETTPINASSYPMATVGVMLLWFGWFGFNTGSLVGYKENLALVAVNTGLAAAAGGVTMIFWCLYRTGKPDVGAVLNGTLAGLVGVTAGANIFSVPDAVIAGACGASVMRMAVVFLESRRIDDVVGAFPVHAAAGVTGTLLVAVLGDPSHFPNGHTLMHQLGIQCLGVMAIVGWSMVVGYGLFRLIDKISPMRVSETDELQGLNFSEHGASTEVHDLLGSMVKQGKSGEFKQTVRVEPHTEVGQIAAEYNKVLDRIRLEIQTREEAYSQLKEASHFQYIFDNSNEGIVQFSIDGLVQKANPAAARLLGYATVDRLIASIGPFMNSLQLTDPAAHEQLMQSLRKRGQLLNAEITYTREVDGKTGFAVFTMKSISGNEQQAPCYLASFIDIGERRENEQLKTAKTAADASNQAKSQFLAHMSHELRTPLNAIIGYGELLQEEFTDLGHSEHIPDLQKITDSGKHLLKLINDILDLSKIEAGKMSLHIEVFEVDEVIEQVHATIQPVLSKNANQLNIVKTGELGTMRTDQTKLRQNLFNLLSNATKFTKDGTITLSVKRVQSDKHDTIEFSVSDTGIGMSQQQVDLLFQAFSQADSSISRDYGGTGLGLAITKHYCEMLGGNITVNSMQGEGSTFTMTLPVYFLEDVSVLPSLETHQESSEKTLLIIDDDQAVHDSLGGAFESVGYRVVRAFGGRQGLRFAREFSPDVITLDIVLPDFDGWSVLKTLKSDEELRDIPVILISMLGDQELGQALGAVDYITKPFDYSVVIEKVKTLRAMNQRSEVLIVDDDPTNRSILRRTLVNAGLTVREASNGIEAIEQLRIEAPSVVLLDMMMPEMDGFEFMERLQREPHWQDIQVIIVSAADLSQSEVDWLNKRAMNILQKGTYSRRQLVESVKSVVGDSGNDPE